MPRKTKKNHGMFCLGKKYGPLKGQRTRSKDGCGNRIVMNRVCDTCSEQRCKTHCRCGRARGADATPASAPAPAPASVAVSSSPVGRPAQLGVKLMKNDKWWKEMVADVAKSWEVALSTYMYDDQTLQDTLLERLQAGATVHLAIDDESVGKTIPFAQKSRLRDLKLAGAKVVKCKGIKRGGVHHKKGVICDRRVAYTGGANLTTKSRKNGETLFRMVGPIVKELLEDIVGARETGTDF